jgi:hypothetical protein
VILLVALYLFMPFIANEEQTHAQIERTFTFRVYLGSPPGLLYRGFQISGARVSKYFSTWFSSQQKDLRVKMDVLR